MKLLRAPTVDGLESATQLRDAKRKMKNFENFFPWVHRQHAKCTFCVDFEWTRSSDDAKSMILRVVGGPVGGPNI